MILINTILTIPSVMTKKEYKQRITIINIVIAIYNIEEGIPL